MVNISRKRMARYVVDSLVADRKADVLKQVAAYLVEHKRLREVELTIRDIHAEFEDRGIVLTEVVTAHPLDEHLRDQIKQVVGGKRVELVEKLEPSVLGGLAIETPTRSHDGTLKRRLIKLRESKV